MSSYLFQIGFYCGCSIPVPLLFIREGSAKETDNLSLYKPEELHLDLMERACIHSQESLDFEPDARTGWDFELLRWGRVECILCLGRS